MGAGGRVARSTTDLAALHDAALVERVARGDDAALGELYDRFGRVAYGVALNVLRDPALAEDAVAEGFLSVWRSAARFDARHGAARSWVLMIVRRRAVDVLRANERQRRDVAQVETRSEGSAEDVALLNAERTRVQRTLASLPAAQRTALELAYYGGQTQSQIAARLGIPLGTVKSRLFEGLRTLSELMSDDAPVEETPLSRELVLEPA